MAPKGTRKVTWCTASADGSALAAGHPLELLAERPFNFVGHRHPVDGDQGLEGEGAELVEGAADGGKATTV